MMAIHDLRLAEFLALDATGVAKSDEPEAQDMGALRLAYADHWRPETLTPIPGRQGRYALAADWFATVFLLSRAGRERGAQTSPSIAWEVAGIFSENLLFLGRPHRGALLSVELQAYGFEVRGGCVGRLPPYTPAGLAARRSAYRIAVRRAIAAGCAISECVLADYRMLVNEKKARDEAGQLSRQEIDRALSFVRN